MRIYLSLNFAAPIAAPLRAKFDFVGSPKFCSSREEIFFASAAPFKRSPLAGPQPPTAFNGCATIVNDLLTVGNLTLKVKLCWRAKRF